MTAIMPGKGPRVLTARLEVSLLVQLGQLSPEDTGIQFGIDERNNTGGKSPNRCALMQATCSVEIASARGHDRREESVCG